MVTQPTIFKWRQTEPGLILCAARLYLRYSLSLRGTFSVFASAPIGDGGAATSASLINPQPLF
jgi:hypothetical protein